MPKSPETLSPEAQKTEQLQNEAVEEWLFEGGEEPESLEKDPFDRHWAEGVQRLKDKYLNVEVSKETKGEAESILEKEEEAAKLDYIKQWLDDNKDDLEKEYPEVKEMDEGKRIRFALIELSPEKNPLNALENDEKTQEKYPDHAEKMGDLYVVREGLKKESLDPEAHFLALNFFYKKAETASKDFHHKEKNPDQFSKEEIEASKKEWFRHSKIVRELTEKVTGKDPKEQAEKEAEDPEKKKAFIASQMERFEEIKIKKYDQILNGLSEEEKKYFKAGVLQTRAGSLNREQILAIVGTYGIDALRNIKHKNWFSNKILVGGKEVESEDLDSFLAGKKQELDEKIRKELEGAAEYKWKKETRGAVERRFDEIVREAASPEKAEELIKGKYRAVKENMVKKFEEEAETKRAQEKLKPKKEKKDKRADAAIRVLELGIKEPKEISRYLKSNSDDFCDLMESAGMKVDRKRFKKFAEKKKNRKSLANFVKRFIEFMASNAS